MQIQLTHHARSRLQQRGISASVLDCLVKFGRKAHDHRGAEIRYFDHCSRSKLFDAIGRDSFRRIEDKLDTYVVLSNDGVVITVGHRTKRIHIN